MKKRVKNVAKRVRRASKARSKSEKSNRKNPSKKKQSESGRSSGAKKAQRRGTQASKKHKKVTRRVRKRIKRSRPAQLRSQRLRPIKIQAGPREKTRFERLPTKLKVTKGKSIRLAPKYQKRVEKRIKTLVQSPQKEGETFQHELSVKVKYLNSKGKIVTRYKNLSTKFESDIDEFIAELFHGISYTQYLLDDAGEPLLDEEGEQKTKQHFYDQRGVIQEIVYERIVELPNIPKS